MSSAFGRAYRLYAYLGAVVVLVSLQMVLVGSVQLGAGRPVRAAWFLLLAVSVAHTLPLASSFGLLERTWVRGRQARAIRAGFVAATAVSVASALWGTGAGGVLTTWFLAMSACAIASSAILGEDAWVPVLGLGGASVLVEHMALSSPVSALADAVGPMPAGGALMVAAVVYGMMPPNGPEVG